MATRKKRRTAKQIAATKKMRAGLKKYLAGKKRKNPVRKKRRTVKKRVTKRRTRRNPVKKKVARSAKSHLWLIFKCRGSSVMFRGWKGWVADKSKAALFKTQSAVFGIAKDESKKRGMSKYYIGVASDATTKAQIAAQCNAGKA